MIAASTQVVYIQEPFNNHYFDPGVCSHYFNEPFQYVTKENEAPVYDHVRRMLTLEYNLLPGVRHKGDRRRNALVLPTAVSFKWGQLRGKRPMLKDPFAVFSAPWLAHRFEADVVMLIRHPAAFVSSVKRLQWETPVVLMRRKQRLMRDYLHPLTGDMDRFLSQPRSIVAQAAFFWKLTYFVVDRFRQQYPNWIYVRHKDLAQDPLRGFRRLFNNLSLPYDRRVQRVIGRFTHAGNPRESVQPATVQRLNSAKSVANWRHRLTPHEIAEVRAITAGVWEHFYEEAEW